MFGIDDEIYHCPLMPKGVRCAPLVVGGVVLVARLLTLPRTPWDAVEMRFPFAAMVAISVTASVIAAVAMAMAFGDAMPALLFSFAAGVMAHVPSARLDALSWMFVALALLWIERPVLLGVCAAAAVVCQPQMAISGVALLLAALLLVVKEKRGRLLAALAFVVVLLPFATVPENLSPAGPLNVFRFTLHPWGSKFVALPLLACVAAGIRPLMRKSWDHKREVLMWFAFVHVAFGVALFHPGDGVRYAVPSLMFTALVASEGLRALRGSWIGVVALCALSVWYVWPILHDRVTRPSPPVEAARTIPRNVIVLSDPETAAFARGLPLEEGMRRYIDDGDVRLIHFAHGRSKAPGAITFSRDEHDAYGKLTRNAYRHVSLIPIADRFVALHGVYGLERNESGETWRWLEREAEIRLPKEGGAVVAELRLPAESPIAFNDVRVNEVMLRVPRGQTISVRLASSSHLSFRSAFAFDLSQPDTRRVAVQLLRAGR